MQEAKWIIQLSASDTQKNTNNNHNLVKLIMYKKSWDSTMSQVPLQNITIVRIILQNLKYNG